MIQRKILGSEDPSSRAPPAARLLGQCGSCVPCALVGTGTFSRTRRPEPKVRGGGYEIAVAEATKSLKLHRSTNLQPMPAIAVGLCSAISPDEFGRASRRGLFSCRRADFGV